LLTPKTIRKALALVDPVLLADTGSSNVGSEITYRPCPDDFCLGSVVPFAFRIRVHCWAGSWGERAITESLQCPPHVPIFGLGRIVDPSIAVCTFWPAFALINDFAFRVFRENDRNLVASFITGLDTVWFGAPITNLTERFPVGRSCWRHGAITVPNDLPSKIVFVFRLKLRAVARLMNVFGALVDNRIYIIERDGDLVASFVISTAVESDGASIVVGQFNPVR
jgi:hypothetical protein